MLPATLQFLITMIACAINERMQRKLDYTQEEVRVLKEIVSALESLSESKGVNPDREPLPSRVVASPCGPGRPDRAVLTA